MAIIIIISFYCLVQKWPIEATTHKNIDFIGIRSKRWNTMRKTYLCCPDHIHHRDCNGHLILAIFIVCRLQVPVNEYVLIFHFWSNFVTAGTCTRYPVLFPSTWVTRGTTYYVLRTTCGSCVVRSTRVHVLCVHAPQHSVHETSHTCIHIVVTGYCTCTVASLPYCTCTHVHV